MVLKVAILPSIKATYCDLWQHRFVLLKMLWFPVLLVFLLGSSLELHSWLKFFGPWRVYIIRAFLELLLAMGSIAVLRYLILNENPPFYFLRLRRDAYRPPWLQIPFIFKVTRREFACAAWAAMIFLIARKANGMTSNWLIEQMRTGTEIPNLIFSYSGYLGGLVGWILISVFILWRPYFAVAATWSWKELQVCSKAAFSNILRIVVVIGCLYLPYVVFTHVLPQVLYSLFVRTGAEVGGAISQLSVLFEAILIPVSRFLNLFCQILVIIFAANLWNSGLLKNFERDTTAPAA